MKWIETKDVNDLIKEQGVSRLEHREVFNTTFNTVWHMEGVVLNNNSFIGIYSEGDTLSYLFFEEGK